MNEYHTVFSVLQQSVPLAPLAIPPFIALAATFILGYAVWKRQAPVLPALLVWLLILGAVYAISGGSAVRDMYAKPKQDFRAGNFKVIEGRVANFHPMRPQGHEMETLSVGGVRFSYSDFILTGCFNNTASHGGPLREGLPVRISYTDNCILKLEVAGAETGRAPTH
jgi:hypothetical protein